MAKKHDIKIWTRWFEPVRQGIKTFEVRKDDRNYEVGDILILNEYRHAVGELTGRKLERKITYICRPDRVDDAEASGLAPGFVVLGIASV